MMAMWIDRMRGVQVASVARAIGIDVVTSRGVTSLGHFACAACGQKKRHTKSGDRRGACGITNDGRRWRCYQCDAYGDALDLVRHVEGDRAREWCERWLALSPIAATPLRSVAEAPLRPPSPPPAEEVQALLASCVPVTECPDVSAYLESRGTDPVTVADRVLAVALPDAAELPTWARIGGRPWTALGHRLLVPLYDAGGAVRSVLARRVTSGSSPKTLPPAGFGRAGLVMACPFAREVLRLGARPEWWPDEGPRLRVIVAEGDSDFLAVAVGRSSRERWADGDEHAPAVIGIQSGAWTDEIGARMPSGAEIVIATDSDDAGDRYAASIGRALAPRVRRGLLTVSRWRAAQ